MTNESSLEERFKQLEQQIQQLKERVATLELYHNIKMYPDRVDYGDPNSPFYNSKETALKVKQNAILCQPQFCPACLDPDLKMKMNSSEEYDVMMIKNFNSFPRYVSRHQLERLEKFILKEEQEKETK